MVSLFDMFALWIVIGVPVASGYIVAKKFGLWPGIGAGLLLAVPCVLIVCRIYRARWRRIEQRRRELKEK